MFLRQLRCWVEKHRRGLQSKAAEQPMPMRLCLMMMPAPWHRKNLNWWARCRVKFVEEVQIMHQRTLGESLGYRPNQAHHTHHAHPLATRRASCCFFFLEIAGGVSLGWAGRAWALGWPWGTVGLMREQRQPGLGWEARGVRQWRQAVVGQRGVCRRGRVCGKRGLI